MTIKTRSIIAALLLLAAVFLMQACKHDPPLSLTGAKDADSLYVGTPYIAATPTFNHYFFRPVVIPANNPMTYEGIQLGRMLFYDSTLSLNKRISCGSCHKQQYSFGDNTKLSENVLGSTVRNTPPLINMGMNPRFFWDGRQSSIEDAVNDALNHEMHPDFVADINYLANTPKYAYLIKKAFGRPGDINEAKIEKAISQFIRTLVSDNSRLDQYFRGEIQLTPQEDAGRLAFFDQNLGDCFHCHFDAVYLTFATQDPSLMFANNAIDTVAYRSQFADQGRGAIDGDSIDVGRFKVPTLRNVAYTAPYMHDGRYTTLQQVLGHYSDSLKRSPTVSPFMQHLTQGGLHLDAVGKANLLAFLNALTDTSFIHNPAFSNPFH
jgi:cytochrome c peroxidase